MSSCRTSLVKNRLIRWQSNWTTVGQELTFMAGKYSFEKGMNSTLVQGREGTGGLWDIIRLARLIK